jgi:hypothetical protein
MEADSMAMRANVSVQQRVAFAVAIGYAALPNIRGDIEGVAFARRALDDAARWAAGESVEAEALVGYLMNEREEGVLLFEDRCPDESLPAGVDASANRPGVCGVAGQTRTGGACGFHAE